MTDETSLEDRKRQDNRGEEIIRSDFPTLNLDNALFYLKALLIMRYMKGNNPKVFNNVAKNINQKKSQFFCTTLEKYQDYMQAQSRFLFFKKNTINLFDFFEKIPVNVATHFVEDVDEFINYFSNDGDERLLEDFKRYCCDVEDSFNSDSTTKDTEDDLEVSRGEELNTAFSDSSNIQAVGRGRQRRSMETTVVFN